MLSSSLTLILILGLCSLASASPPTSTVLERQGFVLEELDEPRNYKASFAHPANLAIEIGPTFYLKDDISPEGEKNQLGATIGFVLRLPSNTIGHWEVGFHALALDLGGFHIGYRYIFDYDRMVRPQIKLSIANELAGGDAIDNLVNFSRIGGKAAFAIETFQDHPGRSVRCEIEAFVHPKRIHADLKFGWTWHLGTTKN